LRVAEFADPAQPYLWRQKQQPTFLITALREGLSSLADAGLALAFGCIRASDTWGSNP
jgi:hypothetical protein